MIDAAYIDHLQRANADDLAFYPLTTLEVALSDGQILYCSDNDEPAGYLWHGPIRAGRDTIIYQACVDYTSRRRALGWNMVRRLLEMATAGGALGVRLKCASSADSNDFWQRIGFYCTKVTTGGIKRGRMINHYRTDTASPLFVVEYVEPSTQPIDLKAYQRLKAEGVEMPSRFSRRHYP